MTIIQCKICNKPFQSLGSRTCTDCLEKIDKDFITVRDYIYDNPNSKMDKIIDETSVEKSVIMQLLREGRLILDSPDTEGLLSCTICKKPINTGKMCNECKAKVAKSMNKTVKSDKPAEPDKKDIKASKYNAKMHTDISGRGKQ